MSGPKPPRPQQGRAAGEHKSRARPTGKGGGEGAGGRPAGDERPGLFARQVAARLLSAVVSSRTSLDGLTDASTGHPHFRQLPPRDQALVKAILTAAFRFRGSIEAEIAGRLERPLPPNAAALRHVLHVGAAQILCLDVPDSAAVDLAVASAAADPRSARFAGLVNAVLRRIAREAGRLPKAGADEAAEAGEAADARRDCPDWLFKRLSEQYGAARAGRIAAAHLVRAPVDLTTKADAAGWAARLGGRAIGPRTVRLGEVEGPISALAGFEEGAWWVQDVAATLPVQLFGDVSGRRVADLCAAPGGKTAQLAAAGALVTALEKSASRMKRLRENLDRLKLSAETVAGDLMDFAPEAPFDAVLLDAPCSSTGTIRRHPDVAYTKDDAEIEKLAALQLSLLTKAAACVAPGGCLVFANCSIDRREGEEVAASFLAAREGFRLEPVAPAELPDFAFAVSEEGFLRTTPEMLSGDSGRGGGLDGFFAARFRRENA
ncbi:RsmB/NOP family class I SAM-dependent RNA methyltransferase [Jiella sonneratiae]|uniref:RsmB/NOP family class I SAM-dependent RNA methyltransferase n=1 Tax=Jiella sonneratiae TaxID=2816856 RepID=A0ABS3JAD7_9HYPH|nr:RsmB/NOP family class I SAM-dependent RNA methyltransferase [Jiella sonneratiae]MBO0905531.1 RsmB/NOP family class I SAM-dependent RNA methyltransferase [Jiella sonneratiae]